MMKYLLLVALTVTIAHAVNVYDVVLDEWELYKTTMRKHFRSSFEEYDRLQYFLRSKDLVARHNERYVKGLETYRLSLNQFADRAPFGHVDITNATLRYMEERAQARTEKLGIRIVVPPDAIVPNSVDWNKRGAVSRDVVDQKNCGSCYAITSAGVLEALMYMKYNKQTHLSAQQIVDCSKAFGNYGCGGGTFKSTFSYLATTGLLSSDEYPYENKNNDQCKISGDHFSDKVKNYYFMFDGDEEKLKYAVATYGPVAVGIDARSPKFHFYDSGIYDDPNCGSTLVHAVLVVGYGTDPETDQDYWIIKNSWGSHWGDNGFIKMARNKHMCGIATLAYAAALE